MDEKRLQYIENKLEDFDGFETNLEMVISYGLELIIALKDTCDLYEIAEEGRIHFMEQLAEMRTELALIRAQRLVDAKDNIRLIDINADYLKKFVHAKEVNANLRKQLTEARAELAGRKESNLRYRRQVNERENKLQDLHKQHKAALAEIKRVRVKGGYREMYHDALHRWNEESVGLTERLENMWAEWGECKKQLDTSHVVNDVYKNMVGILELTIELLETNGGK
jgi:DNA repair exonuclease SbcCD ATPase subunit